MAASTYNKPIYAGLKTTATTTIAGLGLSDAYTIDEVDALIAGVSAGAAVWGTITGTLADQTDLGTALSGKAASSHTHAASDITSGAPTGLYLRDDGTWAAPTGGLTQAQVLARGLGA